MRANLDKLLRLPWGEIPLSDFLSLVEELREFRREEERAIFDASFGMSALFRDATGIEQVLPIKFDGKPVYRSRQNAYSRAFGGATEGRLSSADDSHYRKFVHVGYREKDRMPIYEEKG